MDRLDHKIAEKVMGWTLGPRNDHAEIWPNRWAVFGWVRYREGPNREVELFSPSTDPADATKVATHMIQQGYQFSLQATSPKDWYCKFLKDLGDDGYIYAVSRESAICRAALKAVEK